MKKLLALLLSLSMLIMCAPGLSLVASADDFSITDYIAAEVLAGRDGSSWEKAYIVTDGLQFDGLYNKDTCTNGSGKYVKQQGNIELPSTFMPTNSSFSTNYDGQGYTITWNLGSVSTEDGTTTYTPVDLNGYSYFGLFPRKGGETKNIVTAGTWVVTSSSSSIKLGGIVGRLESAAMSDCTNGINIYNRTSSNTIRIGGVVSQVNVAGTLTGLINRGTISSVGQNVGGIIETSSKTSLTLDKCVNYGNISGQSPVGGIISNPSNSTAYTITNCANYGTISSSSKFGGIIGDCLGNITLTMKGCLNAGTIAGNSTSEAAGALIGRLIYDASGASAYTVNVTIEDCYNTGAVTGVTKAGSLLGLFSQRAASTAGTNAPTGTVTIKNFYDIANPGLQLINSKAGTSSDHAVDTTNLTISVSNAYILNGTVDPTYGTVIDTASTLKTVPEGFDTDVWEVSTDEDYPYIQLVDNQYDGEPVEAPVELTPFEKFVASAAGTSDDPYKISTAEEFVWVFGADDYVNTKTVLKGRYFKQTENIVLPADYKPYSSGNVEGTYDGNGKTITLNLGDKDNYVDVKSRTGSHAHFGIFGGRSYMIISNVTVNGEWYITASSAVDVGGVIGRISGGSVTNVTSNVIFHRNSVNAKIGGVIGTINSSSNITVTGAEFHGSINEGGSPYQYAGGIVATINPKVSVSSSSSKELKVTLEGCKNYGNIVANSPAGGIVGGVNIDSGTASDGTTLYGRLIINNCANYGDLNVAGCTGGIIGAATNTFSCYTVTNCLNAGNIYNTANETNSSGTIIGYGAYDPTGTATGYLDITVKDCYNTGIMTFKGSNAYKQMYASAVALGSSRKSGSGTTTFTGSVTIDNFYDIANPNFEALVKDSDNGSSYPINLDAVTFSVTDVYTLNPKRILQNTEGAVAEFLQTVPSTFDSTKWIASTAADYPYIQLKDNLYDGDAITVGAPVSISSGTYVFVSNDYTGLESLTFEGTKSDYYAIVAGKFALPSTITLTDVEYGVMVTKDVEDGDEIDSTNFTEKFVAQRSLTDGTFGILVYGTKMVETDRYYVRPYVKNLLTGDYYYGNGQSFVLNPSAE